MYNLNKRLCKVYQNQPKPGGKNKGKQCSTFKM